MEGTPLACYDELEDEIRIDQDYCPVSVEAEMRRILEETTTACKHAAGSVTVPEGSSKDPSSFKPNPQRCSSYFLEGVRQRYRDERDWQDDHHSAEDFADVLLHVA